MRANIPEKWELIADLIPVRKLLGIAPDVPLRQCAPVARLTSLAIKFCHCHQGLDTFTGDGMLALRKSSLSVHLMNTAESQEFFGP